MADHPRPPCSICERCPYDTRLCLADYWRGVACDRDHVELRFACPLIEVGFTAEIAGLGPWRITDLGHSPEGRARGTVAIAAGRMSAPSDALREVARVFQSRGLFRTVERRALVAALEAAYRAHLPPEPVMQRHRRRLMA